MANPSLYDPFADAGFDDLFRGFFRPVRATQSSQQQSIRIDVTENEKGYVVQAEIPGLRKDDIHVAIEGSQVTIDAEVKKEEPKDGERVLRAERYFGNVYRSFVLPVEIDQETSSAKYEAGVLELTLVKKPALVGRRLAVQ